MYVPNGSVKNAMARPIESMTVYGRSNVIPAASSFSQNASRLSTSNPM